MVVPLVKPSGPMDSPQEARFVIAWRFRLYNPLGECITPKKARFIRTWTHGTVWRISLIRKHNYRVNNPYESGLLKEILWDTQSLVLAIAACLNIAFSPILILVIIIFLNLNQSDND